MNMKEVVTNNLPLQKLLEDILHEDIPQYKEKKGMLLKFSTFAHRCPVGRSDRKVRTLSI